jgi:AcrR family transcriptional regulator
VHVIHISLIADNVNLGKADRSRPTYDRVFTVTPRKDRVPKPVSRNPEVTRTALIAAARREFEEAGYDETNSNKIAIRAGHAPQTFYRHFRDKAEIFLAVYAEWVREEEKLLDNIADARMAAVVLVAHHTGSLRFRRALRLLSFTDSEMRAARAASRKAQIDRLRDRFAPLAAESDAAQLAWLLQVERLTDAAAEGEFADMGVSQEEGIALLAELIANKVGLPIG